MKESLTSRRALLSSISIASGAVLAGCSSIADVFPGPGPPDTIPQSSATAVRGRVVDMNGIPVVDAKVVAISTNKKALAEARTNKDGRFSLDMRRPVWIQVSAEDYHPQVRACSPGPVHRIVVAEATGSATLTFGGDTMFARRFYTESSDRLNPRFQIKPETRRADHDAILSPIAPVLSASNLTSVNLETPLTTRSLRHPTKPYAFASHPVAAEALADAGVDYAAIGNNHAFDALGPGLRDTIESLETSGVGYSGAGSSSKAAWEPHIQQAGDIEVALLSCTTITGDQYEINWTASGPTNRPVTTTISGQERTIPAGIGVARATTDQLRQAVRQARNAADVVVVQIHGGEPYQRTPIPEIKHLTNIAAENGADLVINHHPHVVGGIERLQDAVVAWSLGNLIFDQKIWPTFQSYLLSVTATTEGVARVTADPILLDGFVPYGVVGEPNRTITWKTLVTSTDSATSTRSGVAVGAGTQPMQIETERFTEPSGVFTRKSGWVVDVLDGQIRLGRDLLPTSEFESTDVDDQGYDGTLWRYGRAFPTVASEFGQGDTGGVRLQRVSANKSKAVLSNTRRIPIDGPLTIVTGYQTKAEGATIEVTWFSDTNAASIGRQSWLLSPTNSNWAQFVKNINPPNGATHANVLFTLSPPRTGRRQVNIDNVRLIQWTTNDVTAGRGFDHFQVQDPATVKFKTPGFSDSAEWFQLY